MRSKSARAAACAALPAAVLAAALALAPATIASASAVSTACPAATPGTAACTLITAASPAPGAVHRARSNAMAASTPAGLQPGNLQATYKLQSFTEGMRQKVAFIAAGANPTAAADLAAYRSQWGLPPCTTSDGCLTIENQNGGSTLPATIFTGWPSNDALGMDVISAICPNCHILLVEANSTAISDLATAANTAATTSGVHFVDNSYAGPEISTETSFDTDYDHPGVAMVAAAGDTGYSGTINYPAASPYVISVGGTVLTQGSSGAWADTSAWAGTVSGCSLYETAKPAWQKDTGCAGRTDNDVSAAAATSTSGIVNPLAIAYYNKSDGGTGWAEGGGTTASASIITAVYAMAGAPAANNPAAYPYQNDSYDLTDITTGTTGTCSISYLCTAGSGYDGPTGMGAPDGVQSLTPSGYVKGAIFADQFFKCLDNDHSALTSGNKIDIYTCNGGPDSQTWNANSDGTVTISGTSYCMGVSGGSTANGATVVLWACNGHSDQLWRPLSNGELLNSNSGKCLEDPSSGTNGTQLVIEPCTGPLNQQWVLPYPDPSATGEVHYQGGTNQCLDNYHSNLVAGNTIQIYNCNGGPDSQTWTATSNGALQIGSSWCIDISVYLGTLNNGSVSLEPCSATGNQRWFAESDGALASYTSPSQIGASGTAPFPGVIDCMAPFGTTSGSALYPSGCGDGAGDQWTLP